MTTIDFRTRFEGDTVDLEPTTFIDELAPALIDAHGAATGRYATKLDLPPLTFDVEGELLTLEPVADRLVVRRGSAESLVVTLVRSAFSAVMQYVTSTVR